MKRDELQLLRSLKALPRRAVLPAFLFQLASATAADVQWDNGAGNNEWLEALNWAGDSLPGAADTVKINLGGPNRAVFSGGSHAYTLIRVGDTAGGNGAELEVTGGVLSSSSTTPTRIATGGRTATLRQSGGTVSLGGYLQLGLDANSVGNIHLSGGFLDSTRNGTVGSVTAVSIALGDGNNAQGNVIVSGGELRTRTGVLLGANGGKGRFEMRGGGTASIGVLNAADNGFWVQNSNSVLAASVSNGSPGSIYISRLSASGGTYGSGNVIFMPGSKLEPGFDGPPSPGAWDFMTWDGALVTNGLSLAPGTDTNWSFQFVTNRGGPGPDTLRLIYIAANLSPPVGIVAVPGNARVQLRWAPLQGATSYEVKRGTSAGGPYTSTNATSEPAHLDTGVTNGVTYYYVVNAVMTNGVTGDSFEVRARPFASAFVHPGVMHTIGDLERMRTNVAAANAPWFMGYTNLLADPHSSAAYAMQGPLATITRDTTLPSQWENDCGGAYQNALLWYLTGNPAHAAKAIQILNAWSATCTNFAGSDARLTAGLQGFKFITAAEIVRYTGAPWAEADINVCSNFIRTVLLPVNRMYGGGNWGICAAASALNAGVFLEDDAVFNEALNALKYGAPTECDMGIISYIHPAGFTMEADRDLGHWGLALDNYTQAAATAWCQGADLWTFLGNRLLVAHEYLGQYALTTNVPSYTRIFQCDGMFNGTLTTVGLGTSWAPFWERAFHVYQNLVGIPAPWCSNMANRVRPEGYDRDHIAFGTLVSALPPRPAGLPVLPSGLAAVSLNDEVELTWSAASGASGYRIQRADSRGGPYVTIGASEATQFSDTTVSNGTFYHYRISATNASGETAGSGIVSAFPSAYAPAAPESLTARTTSHQRVDLNWSPAPGATSYIVKRAHNSGGPYDTIATGVGTQFLTHADAGLVPDTTYFYAVSAVNSMGAGADSAGVSARTLPALPASWYYADAGYPTTPGFATYTNGAFTVRGAGLDHGGGVSDSFGLAYIPMTGDGEIVARIAALTNYSRLNKSGITMRESLANGSRNFFLLGTGAFYRTVTGGNASTAGNATNLDPSLPQWLKLNRTGNLFTGSISSNGVDWQLVNAVSIPMNATVMAGLVVCSRNNGHLDTAVFDNVSVTGLWPALPETPAGVTAMAGDGEAMIGWSAAANATGYNVKRGTAPGGPYASVALNIPGLWFTNTGLANGVRHYFVVSGTNFFGEGADSAEVSVQPVSRSPAAINAVRVPGHLELSWPSTHLGWRVEIQTNSPATGLGTNWTSVPESVLTNFFLLPINPAIGGAFLRLIHP